MRPLAAIVAGACAICVHLRRTLGPSPRLVVLAILLFAGSTATAGTTWDGGGADASWGTANNWNPNGLPLFNGTEAITIGSAFSSGTTLTLDGARYLDSLLINSTAAFTIAAGTGGTLNLRSGNLTRTSSPAGTQTISAGIVLGDPTGVAAYSGNWNIAGATPLVVSGDVSEAGGSRGLTLSGIGSIRLSGNNTFSGGLTMNNSGSLYVTSDANLGAAGGALNLGGLSKVHAEGSFTIARALNIGTGGTGFYIDAGQVVEISGQISGNDLLFTGQPTGVVGGTLVLSGSGSNGTGITQVWSGTISYRGSTSIGTGILEIAQGGIVELGNSNLTRPLGNQAGQVWMSISGSSGFAAWGADRFVNFGGAGATVTWGAGAFVPSGASLLLGSSTGNATLDLQNGINLGTATRTVQVARGTGSGPDGELSGVISGTASLNIAINGTGGRLLLSNGNNSYTGSTNIFGGELWLSANATSGAGNTVLGSGSAAVELGKNAGTDDVSLMTAAAITIGRNITVLSTNTGTATLGGVIADASTFSGNITLGSNTTIGHALTLSAVSGGTVTVSGVIADPAGLSGAKGSITKAGAGTVVLSGANTYAGTTMVNGGVLNLRNSLALGGTAGGTTVNNGGELQLQSGIAIGAEALTLNGTGASGNGALRNISGNNSWAGNITLGMTSLIQSLLGQLTLSGTLSNSGSGADFYFDGAGDTVVSGVITGNADVIKNGTGTVTLQGTNTYTGGTFVNGGTLRVTGSLNGTTGTALTFGGDGTFNFNEAPNTAQNMGVLTFSAGDGNVQSTYGGSGNTSLTFSSLAPYGPGATGNFIISGGTNGTTNKIVLTGQPTGFINGATFFNGDEYAYVDPAGYVRGINYGVDPGTAFSPGGVSLSGDHVKTNGHITSQGTQRFETIHIAANIQYTLGANQKVTVNSILKTGNVAGGATINSGDYLQADSNAQMTIRTARENDFLTITTPIVANGTNAVTKSGTGTLTLSGVNTYTGGTYVTDGTLQIGASERLLNSGSLTVSGGTFNVQGFNETVGAVVLKSGAINGTGTGTVIGSSFTVESGSASAILAGAAAMTKNTDGTVTLTGANTFTGSTTINAGTLVAAGTSGAALGNTPAIVINAAGELLLGANDQINNVASLTLAGGTFSKGNFSEGSASSPGLGALDLTAPGGTLDFGLGTVGVLTFSTFNPGANSLLIDNWTGTVNTVGDLTTDRLIFQSDQTANLSNFLFTNYQGATQFALGGGFYEVTPFLPGVPEINPAFAASVFCVLLAIFTHARSVRAKARPRVRR